MPYLRPIFLFDTSVCIEAAKRAGAISQQEWKRALRAAARKRYRFAVSWVTWKELLVRISRSESEFWDQNKGPLRMLTELPDPIFLPKPRVYPIEYILGINVPTPSPPGKMRNVLEAALAAHSKQALKEGVEIVRPRRHKRSCVLFDLDHFDNHENLPQRQMRDLSNGLRDGTVPRSDGAQIVEFLLSDSGVEPTSNRCQQFGPRVDAALRYVQWTVAKAPNGNFDFGKHLSDWDDIQQLLYLSDERIRVVSRDKDFDIRTKGSPQAGRILLWKDFVRHACASR